MKIDKITIIGVDNKTSIIELERLTEEFPFVEWGVLFTKDAPGRPRYPEENYIKELCTAHVGNMSAHFCGAYPKEILNEGNLNSIATLNPKFTSIQMNYNFSRNNQEWNYNNIRALEKVNRDIIWQFNNANAHYVDNLLRGVPNFRCLFDMSGGRGIEINKIEKPYWSNYTGYAGGINVNTINSICTKIQDINLKRNIWIDLESGARNDQDVFDVNIVKKILNKASKFIIK